MAFIKEISDRQKGIFAVITVAMILGSTSSVIKELLLNVTPATQLALRFTSSAIIFLPFIGKLNLCLVREGAMLGILLFGIFTCETIGIETISAHQASFIFGFNVIFVTLFELVFCKKFQIEVLLAAILAFSGIGIMSWEGGDPLSGSLWLFCSAIADSAYIILREKIAEHHSSLALTAIQLSVVAALSLVWAAPEIVGQIEAVKMNLGLLSYLGIVGSGLMTLLMMTAQRWVSAQESAVILSLEPVFGAVFAFWLLGETFGIFSFIGAAMVLVGIILIFLYPVLEQAEVELTESK
ncbi:DMT family transporter [Kamptonema animale CS-326]|jgi:drug/metabolite transporter (DMT)-like permease|uniref:DMT family transporter n=1 Tax=Kamptonema animale TaxID=92934 RepID=UPI00232E9DEC|nr:DMT family transporter [Kamptonema animale]MDB9512174.1 DMT family transporter [Kamptonema animale CS-326]